MLLPSSLPWSPRLAAFSRDLQPSRTMHTARTAKSHANPLGLPRAQGAFNKLPVKQRIANVQRVVLVSSAKGGVGKSTVAVNTALALKAQGRSVGLLDGDVFGPSIPKLLQLEGEPRLNAHGQLLPLSNYGLPSMSMGYLVRASAPVVWRGLMVMKALQQLLFEVAWPRLDYLVVDMPPGTGDTQLTISQQLHVDGAVIVTTPQDIALIDAVKGIAMFEKVHIPILGMVENMSHFECPHCHHHSHVFGTDGARREADRLGMSILGSIPLSADICNEGRPVFVGGAEPIVRPYKAIAQGIMDKLGDSK